jgi:hypothetical protein
MDLLRRHYRGGHPTKGERPHLAADTIASELRHIAATVPHSRPAPTN